MRRKSVLIGLVLFAAFVAPASAQQGDPEIATLVQGNNDFGLKLYKRLAEKDGNIFFSPYSISNALAMTYAGARGNTAAQMKTTLRFNLADDRLHPAFAKLIASLHDVKRNKEDPEPCKWSSLIALGPRTTASSPIFKIGTDCAGLEKRLRRTRKRRGKNQRVGRKANRTRSRTSCPRILSRRGRLD